MRSRVCLSWLVAACVAMFAVPGSAQCLDFAPGVSLGPNVWDRVVTDMVPWSSGGGSALVLAGSFRSPSNVYHGLAIWDGTNTTLLGQATFGTVTEVAVFDDGTGPALYAAGSFTQIDGQSMNRIAKWDGTSWSALGTGIGGTSVLDLLVYNDGSGDALYVSGNFTTAGGLPASRIAKWDGTNWSTLGTGFNAMVFALHVHDFGSGPELVAGGNFSNAGGSPAASVAAWNGSNWHAVSTNNSFVQLVRTMATYNGVLYVGGNAGTNFIRLVGTTWQLVLPNINSEVHALTIFDDGAGAKLYLGGLFTGATGLTMRGVASWDGTVYAPLSQGITDTSGPEGVYALGVTDLGSGTSLYVGGDFEAASGVPSDGLARWPVPCSPVTITQAPADMTAVYPNEVRFTVAVSGTQPFTYQWRHNGVPLANGDGVEFATTPSMRRGYWDYNDAGQYDCVITNPVGTVISPAATLTVPLLTTAGIPAQVDLVMRDGDPVPDVPGSTYFSCGGISTTRIGTVLSTADIDLNGRRAYALGIPPALTTIQQYWDPAPGLPAGVRFSIPTLGAVIRGTDTFVFSRTVTAPNGGPSSNWGLWLNDSVATDLVLFKGDQLPFGNTGDHVEQSPQFFATAAGLIAMNAEVYNGGLRQYIGILTYDRTNGLQRVLKSGDAEPSGPGHFIDCYVVHLYDNGDLLIQGRLDTHTGYQFNNKFDDGLWLLSNGTLQTLVKSGDLPPGYTVNDNFDQFQKTIVDDAGLIYFAATVAGPTNYFSHAMYVRQTNGALNRLIAQGDPAPDLDPSSTFSIPSPIAAPGTGALVFETNIQHSCPTQCPDKAIFRLDANGFHKVVARHEDPLPAVPPFTVVQDFTTTSMNVLGEVLVEVRLSNHGGAIYGWTETSGLFPIAVPGMQYEIVPGDYRTVQEAHLGDLDDDGDFVATIILWGSGRALARGSFTHFLALSFPCPQIVTQAQSQTVVAATPVTLSIQGSGLDPLTYQWFKDGLALADGSGLSGSQTNTLSIASTLETDTGIYTCEVSNTCGFVTSRGALLTVGPGLAFCTADGKNAAVAIPCPCGNAGAVGRGCGNSVNSAGGWLTATGTTIGDDVVLHGSGMPAVVTAIYLKGDVDNVVGTPFGDGIRCVDGSLIRLRAKANVGGASQFPEPGDPTLSDRGGTPPGSGLTGYYQVYYRNAAPAFCPPLTFNVTNGVRIDW